MSSTALRCLLRRHLLRPRVGRGVPAPPLPATSARSMGTLSQADAAQTRSITLQEFDRLPDPRIKRSFEASMKEFEELDKVCGEAISAARLSLDERNKAIAKLGKINRAALAVLAGNALIVFAAMEIRYHKRKRSQSQHNI